MSQDNITAPAAGPTLTAGQRAPLCMLIEALGRYEWLNPVIMKILRERYGTRFVLVVGSNVTRTAYMKWCSDADHIIVLDDVEREASQAGLGVDTEDTSAEARRNEDTYGLTYLQDIIQQDRTIYGTYLSYAASSWSKRKVPDLDEATCRINYFFRWANELFDRYGIDLVNIRPGGLLSTTLVHAAMHRCIPVTMSRPARYGSYVTWTYGPYSAGDVFEEAYRRQPVDIPVTEDIIRPPEGSRQVFEQFQRQISVKALARSLLLATYNHVVHSYEALREGILDRMPSYISSMRDIVYSWWSMRHLEGMSERDMSRITKSPFLLFLLPKEPEYTVQSLAREFSNVQAIVLQMALAMPAGYKLLVKEHSRVGYRRLDFYRDLLKMPNVMLVSATIPGLELISRAAAVSTVAGTAALEAALMGKPSIVFTSRIEYTFLPSIRVVSSFMDLASTVREALRPRQPAELDQIRRDAARYRRAVQESSFDAPGTKVFEGNAKLSEEQANRAVDILLHVFNMLRDRNGEAQRSSGS